LLVDDHLMFTEAVSWAISSDASLSVVGTATTVQEAVDQASTLAPDVILMDYRLPDGTGADATTAILDQVGEIPILMLSAEDSDGVIYDSVHAGVRGFLCKTEPWAVLADATRRVARNETLISPEYLARLIQDSRKRRRDLDQVEPLTDREQEVLLLLANGESTRSMADTLVVSSTTIRTHVQHILEKLEAHSRMEAVIRATQLGLLPTRSMTAR
jgi:DNA-binding NarL/FixJ family response regulator